jgi:hypothetical protein
MLAVQLGAIGPIGLRPALNSQTYKNIIVFLVDKIFHIWLFYIVMYH